MPLIYTAPSSTASETVTSSDSILTAVTNPSKAGVLLRAMFTGTQPPTVTFYRTDPAGVKVVVRSGDPAPLISGTAFAYDHEARPGVAHSYTVKGATESTAAVVTLPTPDGRSLVKSLAARVLRVRTRRTYPVESQQYASITEVLNAKFPYAISTGRSAGRLTIEVETTTSAEESTLAAVLDEATPVLWQPRTGLGPDRWLLITSDTLASVSMLATAQGRVWQLPAVELDRPLTTGAPLLMPGWGWTEATAGMASMTEVQAAYPTMWDMLKAGVA